MLPRVRFHWSPIAFITKLSIYHKVLKYHGSTLVNSCFIDNLLQNFQFAIVTITIATNAIVPNRSRRIWFCCFLINYFINYFIKKEEIFLEGRRRREKREGGFSAWLRHGREGEVFVCSQWKCLEGRSVWNGIGGEKREGYLRLAAPWEGGRVEMCV